MKEKDTWLSVYEVAYELKKDTNTVRNWIKKGYCDSRVVVRIGRKHKEVLWLSIPTFLREGKYNQKPNKLKVIK